MERQQGEWEERESAGWGGWALRGRSQGACGPLEDFGCVRQASLGKLSRGSTWPGPGFNGLPLAACEGGVGGGEQEGSSRGQFNGEFFPHPCLLSWGLWEWTLGFCASESPSC